MHKIELRRIFKKNRSLLSSEAVYDLSLKIANQAILLAIWEENSIFHIFLSIVKNNEVNTEPLITLLQGRDKDIVVPKVYSNGVLKNYLLTDNMVIKTNDLGIPEPVNGIEINEQQIQVVFVPLLAFDLKGNRVGYGGGYYDRFLKKCHENTVKVGLSLFDPVEAIEDVDEHDIRLDYCITPNMIYEF